MQKSMFFSFLFYLFFIFSYKVVHATTLSSSTETTIPSGANFAIPSGANFAIPSGANFAIPSGANFAIPSGANFAIPSGLVAIPNDEYFSKSTFVVDKKGRKILIYQLQGDLPAKIAEHPADIGKNNGPKEKANDHKTPVGIYFLNKELTQPDIPFDLYGNYAFVTDYPNIFDKREDKTGNGIWLHAVPDSIPLTRGSRGCVVVKNDVIKDLRVLIKTKQTPLLIFEDVSYLSEIEHKKQKDFFLNNFEKWKNSWENQNVDSYIEYYDSSFKNEEMNYSQWYRHKKKLKELYSYIKVQLSSPLILRNKDQIVIRTIQKYESNLHKDYGEKTIHARIDKVTGFKIIREDWTPLDDPVTSPLQPHEIQKSAEVQRSTNIKN